MTPDWLPHTPSSRVPQNKFPNTCHFAIIITLNSVIYATESNRLRNNRNPITIVILLLQFSSRDLSRKILIETEVFVCGGRYLDRGRAISRIYSCHTNNFRLKARARPMCHMIGDGLFRTQHFWPKIELLKGAYFIFRRK